MTAATCSGSQLPIGPPYLRRLLLLAGLAVPAAAAPALAHGQDACAELATNVSNHTTTTNHALRPARNEQTIRLENRGCRLDARIYGDIAYTADFRGIAAISAGGSFELQEETRGVVRRLELTEDGGALTARYRVGRDARAFDAATQAWLADRLLLLFRRAGLAATERAPAVLAAGGLDALLREAEQVHSSSARAIYLSHALQQPDMTDAGVRRILGNALPTSSSARTEILLAVADRGPLRGSVGDAFLEAVAATSSSSSQRELLERALQDGNAPIHFIVRALATAGGMSSSSAQSAVLQAVAAGYEFDNVVLAAYLDAADRISSTSGQRDALAAALGHEDLTDAQLARTLRAVGRISSSGTQADLLVGVARSRRLGTESRAAYVDVATSISSSSQRARALAALERGTG